MAGLADIFRPGPIAAGTSDLFSALASGGRVQEAAKQKEELRLLQVNSEQAELDRKITQAMLERDKRKSQQEYAKNFEATGVAAPMAALLSGAMIGGDANLEQAQTYNLRSRAEGALGAEGFTPANAILGALQGKPIEAIDTQGGQNIRGQFGANPVIEDTAETLSKIVANNARASSSAASADLYRTKADAGGFAPTRTRTTAIEDAAAILNELRSEGKYDMTGVDAKMIADSIKRTGEYKPHLRKPGTLRIIQAGRVEDIPLRGAQPKGNEPSPIDPVAQPPARIKTDAEYDRLATGAKFIGPDGVLRIKQ